MTKPNPFIVDPDVMAKIRPMQARDIPQVAALHGAAMGDSLWAQLGDKFLRTLYSAMFDNHRFLAFVFEEDNTIKGFIAGSSSVEPMMSEVFNKSWLLLGSAALRGISDFGMIKKLATTRQYFRQSKPRQFAGSSVDLTNVSAESLFCSFVPELRGRRISGHINKVLFDELFARGHSHVKVTTETDNIGANRQLSSWGFVNCGTFSFYNKEMVTFALDLEKSERVEPVSRHPAI